MARFLRLLLLGLVGAGIVHIAVLLLVPVFSEMNAWSRLEAASDGYRFNLLDKRDGPPGDRDPLIVEATCRFDLADGPVRITAGPDAPYWSLSVYAPNGDNLYSLNDSVSAERKLDLIVADPIAMASLRADGKAGDGPSILIEQDIGEGMASLRAFMPDPTWRKAVDRFFAQAGCATYDGS